MAQKQHEDGRNYEKGILWKQQTRGQGWTLRNLAFTAFITPDADPRKGYWQDKLANNRQWYTETYVDGINPPGFPDGFPYTNPLGWIGRTQKYSG
ncbi:MAG: hypothetical protein ABEK42_09815, partial [Thiohalorhabdaceae bacterium]